MQHKVLQHASNWPQGVKLVTNHFLKSKKSVKILIEQNRNLGDTLHLIPIIRHYRQLEPNACILFLVGKPYVNAHAYNPDVNGIITIPSLNPQQRIKMRKTMLKLRKNGVKVIAPSIFPYASIWPELKWSFPVISDQYFKNAGIKDMKPKGGKKLVVYLENADKDWAQKFAVKHGILKNNSCGFEYNSYSDSPKWSMSQFNDLVKRLNHQNVKCISFAGPKEGLLKGTIDARGTTWRQTVALLNHIGVFCGVGSGITMLATCCKDHPKIIELCISDSITMQSCGYAKSQAINGNPQPGKVAKIIVAKLNEKTNIQKPKK